MIRQTIYLERARGWKVTCYYAVTHYEIDEILQTMERAGADDKSLKKAYNNLSSGNPNCGICYSGKGESVLVVTVTTNVEEFADSIDHEKHHLAVQIADVLKWNLKGEEVCYLAGEIGRKMHPIVSHYLCENCRGY